MRPINIFDCFIAVLILFSTSQMTVPMLQCFTQQNNARVRYVWFIWEEFQDPPRMRFWGYPMSICFLCPPTRNTDRLETEHAGKNNTAEFGGSLEMLFLSVGPLNREHATPLERFMPSHRNSLFLILSRLPVQANGKAPVLHNTERKAWLWQSILPLLLIKWSSCSAFPSLFGWLSLLSRPYHRWNLTYGCCRF